MVINWWTDALERWSVHYGHTTFIREEYKLQNIKKFLHFISYIVIFIFNLSQRYHV